MLSPTKNFPHIVPDVDKWPITGFYNRRSEMVEQIVRYTMGKFDLTNYEEINDVIAQTIYLEKHRVKTNPWKVDPQSEKQYWKKLENELQKSSNRDNKLSINQDILRKIINRYSEEIAGNFNPKTFRSARKILNSVFKRLFNKAKVKGSLRPWGTKEMLADKIKCYGYINELRALFTKGTVVIVPNHFSNLDSVIMGFTIDTKIGVPAFSYGAGLNLYDTEIVAYFINRLGAYKLDRRKKNPLYLATLKSFSTVSIQNGVNTIFYPGGTRSRSGEYEKYIKLGLFGTMMEAQRNLIQEGKSEKVFIVPMMVGYNFVLEAKSLIQQHLSKLGKEKFIRDSKSSNSIVSTFRFLRKLWSTESELVFNFGQPMDVFGNNVDMEGISYDSRGNKLDTVDYFKSAKEINIDEQREFTYISQLGKKIYKSFEEENIILASHLLAHVTFSLYADQHKGLDIFGLLNLPSSECKLDYKLVHNAMSDSIAFLREKETFGQLILSQVFENSIEEVIKYGLKQLGVYHQKKVLSLKNENFTSEDTKLLFYYHNRLVGYKIKKVINTKHTINT